MENKKSIRKKQKKTERKLMEMDSSENGKLMDIFCKHFLNLFQGKTINFIFYFILQQFHLLNDGFNEMDFPGLETVPTGEDKLLMNINFEYCD